MQNKRLLAVIGLAAISVAVAGFLVLRRTALAQDSNFLNDLPPGADLYAFIDVQALATNPLVQKLFTNPPGFTHGAEYEQFVRATGFRYETDLKRLALTKTNSDWAGLARVHIDRARMVDYMQSQGGGAKQEQFGKTVFTFGQVRPFRLAFLDDDPAETLAAFTAGGNEAQIGEMIERHLGKRSDSAAAEFASGKRFSHIPPESRVWIVGQPARLFEPGAETQVGSFSLTSGFLRGSQMLYASIDPGQNQIKFRIEDYCDSPASAQRISGTLQGILAMARSLPPGKSGKNRSSGDAAADPGALLAGVSVEQDQQSVLLQWQWGEDALKFLQENSR